MDDLARKALQTTQAVFLDDEGCNWLYQYTDRPMRTYGSQLFIGGFRASGVVFGAENLGCCVSPAQFRLIFCCTGIGDCRSEICYHYSVCSE